MRRKAFTILDAVLLAVLLAANWALLDRVKGGADRATAVEVISRGGIARVPLGSARRLEVDGPLGVTVVQLDRTGAQIRSSPCPLQICVRSGRITRAGSVVACLPNRVGIRLLGAEGSRAGGVDAIGR